LRQIIEFLNTKDLHFKVLNRLNPKDYGSKKQVIIYEGIDLHSNFWLIFVYSSKSRFIQKNSAEIMELSDRIIKQMGHNYKVKALFISSPLCSKAHSHLDVSQWRVFNDFV